MRAKPSRQESIHVVDLSNPPFKIRPITMSVASLSIRSQEFLLLAGDAGIME